MAKGNSVLQWTVRNEEMTLNSDKPIQSLDEAKKRVLCLQRKLHRWSQSDADKRFDDLFNLVCDRTTLRNRLGAGQP